MENKTDLNELFDRYIKMVDLNKANLGSHEIDSLHMVLGMITESAELADNFKKKLAYDRPLDFVNMKEELGDIMWYIVGFCIINDLTLADVLETNIRKLSKRYNNGFTKEEAENRNLDLERQELEKLNEEDKATISPE
jgi:NTP pyrophosphatase (non-canonical NTP hydrolase)